MYKTYKGTLEKLEKKLRRIEQRNSQGETLVIRLMNRDGSGVRHEIRTFLPNGWRNRSS